MNLPLKIRILERKISQVALSQAAGIPDATLSKIVNGWHKPNQTQKEKIAHLLGCRPEDIFPGESNGRLGQN